MLSFNMYCKVFCACNKETKAAFLTFAFAFGTLSIQSCNWVKY